MTTVSVQKLQQKSWEEAPEEESREATSENTEGVDMICWDRLFQVRTAASGKAWSPMVDSRVCRNWDIKPQVFLYDDLAISQNVISYVTIRLALCSFL